MNMSDGKTDDLDPTQGVTATIFSYGILAEDVGQKSCRQAAPVPRKATRLAEARLEHLDIRRVRHCGIPSQTPDDADMPAER